MPTIFQRAVLFMWLNCLPLTGLVLGARALLPLVNKDEQLVRLMPVLSHWDPQRMGLYPQGSLLLDACWLPAPPCANKNLQLVCLTHLLRYT